MLDDDVDRFGLLLEWRDLRRELGILHGLGAHTVGVCELAERFRFEGRFLNRLLDRLVIGVSGFISLGERDDVADRRLLALRDGDLFSSGADFEVVDFFLRVGRGRREDGVGGDGRNRVREPALGVLLRDELCDRLGDRVRSRRQRGRVRALRAWPGRRSGGRALCGQILQELGVVRPSLSIRVRELRPDRCDARGAVARGLFRSGEIEDERFGDRIVDAAAVLYRRLVDRREDVADRLTGGDPGVGDSDRPFDKIRELADELHQPGIFVLERRDHAVLDGGERRQ